MKKKHIKAVLILILALLLVLAVLKLISIWDSKQGAVDIENIQMTAPPVEETVQMPSVSVREPTSEEIESLADGSITKNDLIQDLVDDAVVYPSDKQPNNKDELPQPGGDSDYEDELPPPDDDRETVDQGSQNGQPIQTEYEQRLAEIIAEVYVLRDEYIGTLETMYSEAEAILIQLAAEEGNEDAIMATVGSYISEATNLEHQCDGRIDALMAELEELLKTHGQSLDLADEIRYTYAQEKSLKKAWYMSEMERRGLY